MGSVQSEIKCEQCSYESATDDYCYKTGEWRIFCPRCGYRKSYEYITDEKGKYVMKTDVYEIDGKTVGYVPHERDLIELEESDWPIKQFHAFHPNITQEELEHIAENAYIIKTDDENKEIQADLSFWYDRKIIKEKDKTFLRHTHPASRLEEKQGMGICYLGDSRGGRLYYLEELELEKALELVKEPQYKEHSYITQFANGEIKILYGKMK